MNDIHSHLVFDVDDGAYSLDESGKMMEEAARQGIKTIIATPHFHKNIFESEKTLENFKQLVYLSKKIGIRVEIGYEVFLTPFIVNILEEKGDLTLAGSRYMLIELPLDRIPLYSSNVIYKLQLQGIVPILAHPERNRNFIRNFKLLKVFIEMGCLIQLDAASILGVYGIRVKEFSRKLITGNLVDFVASDAHCPADYAKWYRASYYKVCKWVGEECAQRLYSKNPQIILNDIGNKKLNASNII